MQSFNHSELRKLGVTMENFNGVFVTKACEFGNVLLPRRQRRFRHKAVGCGTFTTARRSGLDLV